jgi:hypothetical protein
MQQDNLSAKHNPEWAMFLPAISSFYISGLGQQRCGKQYFDPTRLPAGIQDTEMLNFLNSQKGLYTYKWGLYSAGHADLDTTKSNDQEDLIRNREAGTFLLGDSGGFQISMGVWPANWSDPNCPRAMAKRKAVLNWMDTYMDYGMVLDIPTTTLGRPHVQPLVGIHSYQDAVNATRINNDYFINNRSGRCKFLNVLQGTTHAEADDWYAQMKDYCDPHKYPDRHFNGWAAGGRNKLDVQLILKRLVNIIHDGLLEQGLHDWIHYLGISWMEYAILYTDIQRAIRKYHNPDLTISFDCASPFYAAAKGQAYHTNRIQHGRKWSYRMDATAENKAYAGDTRPFAQAVVQEGIHKTFTSSPVTDRMTLGDLCYRGVGAVGKHGKETKTSWDTLSYVLLQGHNVWMHINAVQEANRQYEQGVIPEMLMHEKFDRVLVRDVIDHVFAQRDRARSLAVIDEYSWLWKQFYKATNSTAHFNQLFEIVETPDADTADSEELDADAAMADNLGE